MPIRAKKNPFPKKEPLTNSGMFSNSGKGQKLDPQPGRLKTERSVHKGAMGTDSYKSGGGMTGKSLDSRQNSMAGKGGRGGKSLGANAGRSTSHIKRGAK